MDYSVCNALAYNTKDPVTNVALLQALIIYDVACQFFKKFRKRWEASDILKNIYGWFIISLQNFRLSPVALVKLGSAPMRRYQS